MTESTPSQPGADLAAMLTELREELARAEVPPELIELALRLQQELEALPLAAPATNGARGSSPGRADLG
ncbi:hypothetical protein [Frigidibacter oleivorans]|uniref:hypothetical protein n=1 Tax=Frigidibacter oleivorans TaxID=2487129 RepID=UPI000F8E9857|nr:hypothetical protein [Frigidibacter oleivorans]